MKRVAIDMNLDEIKIVLDCLYSLRHEVELPDHQAKALNRLEEVLCEQHENLEQDELHAKMYKEDEDGYESLTDYGHESGAERYGSED